jgi:hypothetical protein
MMHPADHQSQAALPAPIFHAVFPDSFAPPAPWQVNVAAYLLDRGHDAEQISSILDHARTWGSVECLELLGNDERIEVERRLPTASARCWAQHPDRWTTTE